MDDLVRKTVHKLSISKETLAQQKQKDQCSFASKNGISLPTPQSSPTSLPILKRSLYAESCSKRLRDVSPVCVIVVGMAGSGKTTLTAALQRSLAPPPPPERGGEDNGEEGSVDVKDVDVDETGGAQQVGYCLNLDPATKLVPFGASIDIRDTVNYKEVMKQHNLGPNGAIMTSLNLFSTKFDQVLTILEKRAFSTRPSTNQEEEDNDTTNHPPQERKNLDYILVDTPGQIEAFTWSASGSIITSALSSSFPTVLAFVVDTPRCVQSLDTFMSNMLYACSMFYRTRLPLVIVFNKTDVVPAEVCLEWMDDYDKFQVALDEFMDSGRGGGYYATLTRSLSLVLDEFYSTLKKVGVSGGTGDGVGDFWKVVSEAADDFDLGYVGDLKCRVEEKGARGRAVVRDGLRRFEEDVSREG